jgi:hypothetical protein
MDLFPDDFVPPSKWFRRRIPGVPLPVREHSGHKHFIPALSPAGDANPTKERTWKVTAVFAAARSGTDIGEGTWVKSSSL